MSAGKELRLSPWGHEDSATEGKALERILVVINPRAWTHAALATATRIAENLGSTLELLVCDAVLDIPQSRADGMTVEQFRGLVRERRLAMLETLAEPLRERGIQVKTESIWHESVREGIAEHAARTRADLVVNGLQ